MLPVQWRRLLQAAHTGILIFTEAITHQNYTGHVCKHLLSFLQPWKCIIHLSSHLSLTADHPSLEKLYKGCIRSLCRATGASVTKTHTTPLHQLKSCVTGAHWGHAGCRVCPEMTATATCAQGRLTMGTRHWAVHSSTAQGSASKTQQSLSRGDFCWASRNSSAQADRRDDARAAC